MVGDVEEASGDEENEGGGEDVGRQPEGRSVRKQPEEDVGQRRSRSELEGGVVLEESAEVEKVDESEDGEGGGGGRKREGVGVGAAGGGSEER